MKQPFSFPSTLALITLLSFCLNNPLVAQQTSTAQYSPSSSHTKHSSALCSFSYGKRTVPLKIYLPTNKNAPVILLSHGLGGSRETGAYLANHWASRGFAVVAIQHAGSDSSIWKGVEKRKRLKALRKAASLQSYLNRTKDVPAVIDYLNKLNRNTSSPYHQCFNLGKIGIGGHSFGAITSQALAGQTIPKLGKKFTDKRIDAALMLSPSPAKGGDNNTAFSSVSIPWMMMTGTKDKSIIVPSTTPQKRQLVYKHCSKKDKYQLVLKDASHMAFSDKTLLGLPHKNKNHHKVIIATSTAFWETHLLSNARAKKWLTSNKVKSLLQKGDTWETK